MLKPIDKWEYWAGITDQALTQMIKLYKAQPQAKRVLELSARLHQAIHPNYQTRDIALLAGPDTNVEEQQIQAIKEVFADFIRVLPLISTDLQNLLNCTWQEPIGRLATDLFKGKYSFPEHGIRSGKLADGGLVQILTELVESEHQGAGTDRPPRTQVQHKLTKDQAKRLANDAKKNSPAAATFNMKPKGF